MLQLYVQGYLMDKLPYCIMRITDSQPLFLPRLAVSAIMISTSAMCGSCESLRNKFVSPIMASKKQIALVEK